MDQREVIQSPLAKWLFVQMQNTKTFHLRIMARFLRKRGWVVFYLEPEARHCPAQRLNRVGASGCQADCWLDLYCATEKRGME